MITLSPQIYKFAQKQISNEDERQKFLDCLQKGESSERAVIWMGEPPDLRPWPVLERVEWQPSFIDRIPGDVRPGSHELHEAGAYYCFDLSSAFAASAMGGLDFSSPPIVLDMCAAPGGKSIFAWRALHPQQLLANEVIGKRTAALISNFKRCKISNAAVTRLDSSVWCEVASNTLDLVLVDAPCSGQSLLAKGDASPGCFHPATINMNANRQKRILINSAQLVKPQGYLVYMTCTYSRAENEAVIEWLLRKLKNLQTVEIPHLSSFASQLSDIPCYRLWPQQGVGAGAFVCVLRNAVDGTADELNLDRVRALWSA